MIGVEPHGDLAGAGPQAAARARRNVTVHTPPPRRSRCPTQSVDVAMARWAYFFGPGCEPGLAELSRVVRKGGAAFVVDLDATRGSFGRWFLATVPTYSSRGGRGVLGPSGVVAPGTRPADGLPTPSRS